MLSQPDSVGKVETVPVAVPLPRGTYSKVARRIRRSPQHVRAVWLGLKKSARTSAALAKYVAKITQQDAA